MVYVDHSFRTYGKMVLCRMTADEDWELDAMADRIGLSRLRRVFFNGVSYYPVCWSKRKLAVRYGARAIKNSEFEAILRSHSTPVARTVNGSVTRGVG